MTTLALEIDSKQHLYMTLARGVENRRPMIRATNTGLTAAVQADGTVIPPGPIYQKWGGFFQLGIKEKPTITFFSKFHFFANWEGGNTSPVLNQISSSSNNEFIRLGSMDKITTTSSNALRN